MRIISVNRRGNKLYEDDNGGRYAECQTCKEEGRACIKPITDFVKAKKNILGVLADCNECRKEQKKKYRKENPEKTKEYNRSPKRVDKMREHRKIWNAKNPKKVKQLRNTRLIREIAASNAIPIEEKNKALKQYNYSCALTGTENDLHIDHIISLGTGHASNSFEDLLLLRSDLNISKNARNIFEWAEQEYEHFGFTLDRFYEVMTEVASRSNMSLDEYKEYTYWCFNNPTRG
jgi:5-methylcytosine-specific restriction endonuclease McrA